MGYTSAVDFREHAASEDQALCWHLSSNHYPSIYSDAVLASVKVALRNARNGEWDKGVRWTEPKFQPRQCYTRNHVLYVKTSVLVDLCHLSAFLTSDEEEE